MTDLSDGASTSREILFNLICSWPIDKQLGANFYKPVRRRLPVEALRTFFIERFGLKMCAQNRRQEYFDRQLPVPAGKPARPLAMSCSTAAMRSTRRSLLSWCCA
jgi:hypothetical protein